MATERFNNLFVCVYKKKEVKSYDENAFFLLGVRDNGVRDLRYVETKKNQKDTFNQFCQFTDDAYDRFGESIPFRSELNIIDFSSKENTGIFYCDSFEEYLNKRSSNVEESISIFLSDDLRVYFEVGGANMYEEKIKTFLTGNVNSDYGSAPSLMFEINDSHYYKAGVDWLLFNHD